LSHLTPSVRLSCTHKRTTSSQPSKSLPYSPPPMLLPLPPNSSPPVILFSETPPPLRKSSNPGRVYHRSSPDHRSARSTNPQYLQACRARVALHVRDPSRIISLSPPPVQPRPPKRLLPPPTPLSRPRRPAPCRATVRSFASNTPYITSSAILTEGGPPPPPSPPTGKGKLEDSQLVRTLFQYLYPTRQIGYTPEPKAPLQWLWRPPLPPTPIESGGRLPVYTPAQETQSRMHP